MNNLCYLIKLVLLFSACVIYSPFVTLSTFIVLSNFCHLLTLCFLHTFYVIKAPYKCTCTTYQTTQLSLSSCHAHALCANRFFQLIKRLSPSCHSDLRGSRHGWGVLIDQSDILLNPKTLLFVLFPAIFILRLTYVTLSNSRQTL